MDRSNTKTSQLTRDGLLWAIEEIQRPTWPEWDGLQHVDSPQYAEREYSLTEAWTLVSLGVPVRGVIGPVLGGGWQEQLAHAVIDISDRLRSGEIDKAGAATEAEAARQSIAVR